MIAADIAQLQKHLDHIVANLADNPKEANRYGPTARGLAMMLAALEMWHAGIAQIVIAGARGGDDTASLLDVLADRYLPFAVVVPLDGAGTGLPFTDGMTPVDSQAAAYVCRDFTCQTPVTTPQALRDILA